MSADHSWQVTVNGKDVSNNMRPYIMTIEVVDKDGTSSDTCSITFDDSAGQLQLPATGAAIAVYLDGAPVFSGFVDSTPWTMTRGGGRVLQIDAKGFDTRSKIKERQGWHLDDATLADALKKGAKGAGLEVVVDPDFGAIERDYWTMDNQNFLEWAEGLAREHGATFKVRGGKAAFVKRGGGLSAVGGQMPTITGKIGENVISVSINPSRGRTQYSKTRVRFFDRETASYKTKEVEVEGLDDKLDVVDESRDTVADEGQAERAATGRKIRSEREAAVGSVTIDLAVQAQAEGTFVLTGARPGIDGTYRIAGVTHRSTRSGGSVTTLDLKQPQGDVGKDKRVPVPTPRPADVPVPTQRPAA